MSTKRAATTGAAAGAPAASASNKRAKKDGAATAKDDGPMAWCSHCSKLVTAACRTAKHRLQSADAALAELRETLRTAEANVAALEDWKLKKSGVVFKASVRCQCRDIDDHLGGSGQIHIALAVPATKWEVQDLLAALQNMDDDEVVCGPNSASFRCALVQGLFYKLSPRVTGHELPAGTVLASRSQGRMLLKVYQREVKRDEGEGARVLGRVTENLDSLCPMVCDGDVCGTSWGKRNCSLCEAGEHCSATLEDVSVVKKK